LRQPDVSCRSPAVEDQQIPARPNSCKAKFLKSKGST
jgi:hypothetical protein